MTEKQYLLIVRNQKGFSRFQLMNVANNYDTLNDTNFGTINGGAEINEVLTEPASSTTFTMTCQEN